VKKVDSQALGIVNRALGLTGSGAPLTELLDGTVEQTLDLTSIIRRGRTQARTAGIYSAILENAHGAANTLNSQLLPYNAGAAAIAPYPAPMPEGFDVWLIGAAVIRTAGAAFTSGALFLAPTAGSQGMGLDDSGVQVVGVPAIPLAFWNSEESQSAIFGIGDGRPWQLIQQRIARGVGNNTGITFSTTSTAAATFQCLMLFGVFPESLGQDAAF